MARHNTYGDSKYVPFRLDLDDYHFLKEHLKDEYLTEFGSKYLKLGVNELRREIEATQKIKDQMTQDRSPLAGMYIKADDNNLSLDNFSYGETDENGHYKVDVILDKLEDWGRDFRRRAEDGTLGDIEPYKIINGIRKFLRTIESSKKYNEERAREIRKHERFKEDTEVIKEYKDVIPPPEQPKRKVIYISENQREKYDSIAQRMGLPNAEAAGWVVRKPEPKDREDSEAPAPTPSPSPSPAPPS